MVSNDAEDSQNQALQMATVPQLNGLKKNLEHEIQQLDQNRQTLQVAHQRMKHATGALEGVKATEGDTESMIPMTGSVYMKGVIKAEAKEKILLDVGTGYFVEQPIARALKYCKKKADLIEDNAVRVTQVIKSKVKSVEMVQMQIQMKMQAAENAGEADA